MTNFIANKLNLDDVLERYVTLITINSEFPIDFVDIKSIGSFVCLN